MRYDVDEYVSLMPRWQMLGHILRINDQVPAKKTYNRMSSLKKHKKGKTKHQSSNNP